MSTKTVGQKLALKAGARLWLSDESKCALIEPLPDGVEYADDINAATSVLLFVDSRAAAVAALDACVGRVRPTAALWVAYPKGGKADINRDSLHPLVQSYGWRPNSQVAVDDTWSALRFRPFEDGEAAFGTNRP